MDRKGPLADSYWAAVVLVLSALTPFLVLSSALFPLQEALGKGTGLSESGLRLTNGMADAAYCFGTVLAVQMLQRLPARRVLVAFAALFLLASIVAAWAPTPGLFAAGHVVQGLATSLMLIAAVPPLIVGWPVSRLRPTAITMNMAIFGAVALGPVVGGVFAHAESWRPLFWIVAGFGAAALLFVLLTYEDAPPQDSDAPVDVVSIALAASGCAALFYGVSQLAGHRFAEAGVAVPLVGGALLIVALIAHQLAVSDPLMPVRKLANTIPVGMIAIAMCAGAASVGLVQLSESALELRKVEPLHAAMLYWPEFAGAILTAFLLGALFFTRWVPAMAFGGALLLAGAAAVLSGAASGSDAIVLVGSGLTGLGVGSSVSPALFSTGFSLPSNELPRVFALIELLRGVAAFSAGPILLHVSETAGSTPADGIETAIWITGGIALAGALFAATVFAAGRARLQTPDLERWVEGEEPAIHSPPLGGERAPGDPAPSRS